MKTNSWNRWITRGLIERQIRQSAAQRVRCALSRRNIAENIHAAAFFLFALCGQAAVLDFESINGAIPYEGMVISNQFEPHFGIRFRRESDEAIPWPIIARVGAPLAAFARNARNPADTPRPADAAVFGELFLTDTAGDQGGSSKLILDFTAPVSKVSGYILDIDGTETVTVSIFADASSETPLESHSFSEALSTSGDGIATFWSFERSSKDVRRVEIDGRGAKVGYDLFSSDYVPPAPTNPTSLGLRMLAGIWITGDVGRLYRIDYADKITGTTTMEPTNWVALTNIFLPSSPFLFVDVTSTNSTRRFYRAVSLP